MIFFLGFSLTYLLNRIFSYNRSVIMVLIISGFVYLSQKTIFKKLKNTLITFGVFALGFGTYSYYLYREDRLLSFLENISNFFRVYFLSMSTGTIFIDGYHILVILILITFLVFRLMIYLCENKKVSFWVILLVNLVISLIGYFYGSLVHVEDRFAFNLIVFTTIMYYFYYLSNESADKNRRNGFYRSAIVWAIVVLIASNVLYQVVPNPFEKPVGTTYTGINSVVDEHKTDKEIEFLNVDVNRTRNEIDESFEYDNTLVLTIESEYVNYLKSNVYEIYYDGNWYHSSDIYEVINDKIYESELYDPIEYEKYYRIDPVKIQYKKLVTNSIMVNTYGSIGNEFGDDLQVFFDSDKGVYFLDDPLTEGYQYEFDAIIPRYGSIFLSQIIEENEYRQSFDENYITTNIVDGTEWAEDQVPNVSVVDERLVQLAKELTKDEPSYYQKALIIERYLKSNYNYDELPYVGEHGEVIEPVSDDKIVDFLFYNEDGFCQHFASSMTMMLQSVGVQSRYVTGFRVRRYEEEELNDIAIEDIVDKNIAIYDSNAHSWVEAYFPEVGWVMFEPTPGMVYFYEETFEENERELEELENIEENGFGTENIDAKIFSYIAMVIILIGIIFFIVLLSFRYKRRSNEWKINKLYLGIIMYQRLRRIRKEEFETPREYANRFDELNEVFVKKSFVDIISVYEGVTYGSKSISDEEVLAYKEYLRQIKRTTKRYSPLKYLILSVREFFMMVIES